MSIRVDKISLELEVRERKQGAELVKLNNKLEEASKNFRNLQKQVDALNYKQEKNGKLTTEDATRLADLKQQLADAKEKYKKLDRQKTEYVARNKLETMTINELYREYKSYSVLIKNLDPKFLPIYHIKGYKPCTL